MPFKSKGYENSIDSVVILILYLSVYLKDLGSLFINSSSVIIILIIGCGVGITRIFFKTLAGIKLWPNSFNIIAIFSVFWIVSFVFTQIPNFSSYYLSILIAFIIINTNPRLFIIILLIHFLISISIQSYEYISGQYFFIYEANDGTLLDESLFGGSLDIFRAKGLFQGPLSAVAFSFWIVFLLGGNLLACSLLFLSSFFGAGRLGIFVSLLLFLVSYFNFNKNIKYKYIYLIIIVSILALIFSYGDEIKTNFLVDAFNIDNDQNYSRIEFWLSSLNYYLNYNLNEIIFGKYGFILFKEGGTENDFLRILLDCGLSIFLIYFSSIVYCAYNSSIKKNWFNLFLIILIFFIMNIFPFIQSLASGILFWLFYFYIIKIGNKK